MGCDIHIHCEYRKNEDSPWINCDSFRINPRILSEDEWENYASNDNFLYDPKMWREDIYDGRDYELFGILAGVRSCEVNQIKEPVGVPSDMHWLTKKMVDKSVKWGHSYTTYTARELFKAYDKMKRKWKKAKKKAARIEDDYYTKYALDENDYYIGSNNYHHMDSLINSIKENMKKYLYCFDQEDRMNDSDNFRLIMYFDS